MSSGPEKRKNGRVEFSKGIDVHIVAIDGTWRRACRMWDASVGGAKLTALESIEGLPSKEFFLLLSSPGLAFRRCELAWVNGDQLGVRFLENRASKRGPRRETTVRKGHHLGVLRGAS